jgi:DNA-binding NarL/FixJ family response regulator
MNIRLLFATPDAASLRLFEAVLASALELTPLDIHVEHASSSPTVLSRARQDADDVVLLDWLLAQQETSALIRKMLATNPRLRIVTILPLGYRQYRAECWQAGACTGIAKEHMDQEWMSSVLCIMRRAMEREARLRASLAEREGMLA